MIMHEEFSHSLSHFIPGPDTPWDDIRRSTSCFIGLSEHVWQTPLLAEKYAPNDGDWHLATHKIQRNPRYHLSPEQRTRFSKAMRTLKLRPYYNPINMKTDMQPCDEEDFWTAVCEPHNVCTDPSREPMGQKMRRLDDYIERKSQGSNCPWSFLIKLANPIRSC